MLKDESPRPEVHLIKQGEGENKNAKAEEDAKDWKHEQKPGRTLISKNTHEPRVRTSSNQARATS